MTLANRGGNMGNDRTKTDIGEMPCPNADCESHRGSSRPVIVFENSKGTLSYTCDKCGSSQYAQNTKKIHAAWMRRIGAPQEKTPAATVGQVVAAASQAAEKPAKRSTIFG